MRRGLSLFLSALAVVAVVWVLLHAGRQGGLSPFQRAPVLLVHGHGLTPEYWDELTAHLVGIGYPREYIRTVEIRPSRMPNVEAAERFIAPAAERLIEDAASAARSAGVSGADIERIDIVSHSMGAVSSRWYATRMQPERVRTFVTIAGANSGTDALCEHTDDAAREMCPAFAASEEQSAIQVELNGTPDARVDQTPFGIGKDPADVRSLRPGESGNIAYFTIRIELDEWIVPASSAELRGAGGVPVKLPTDLRVDETSPGNYMLPGVTHHDSLPRNERIIELVVALLGARD